MAKFKEPKLPKNGFFAMDVIGDTSKLSQDVGNKYLEAVRGALEYEAMKCKDLFLQATDTWNHQPVFKVEQTGNGNKMGYKVTTKSLSFKFVNDGTKIMWAVLSDDWQSKTSPANPLNPTFGRGGVVLRGKQALEKAGRAPRKGIEPRNITGAISDIMQPIFYHDMNILMKRFFNKHYVAGGK